MKQRVSTQDRYQCVHTSEIPLFPPVVISLPDVRMCDASHDDDNDDDDVVCKAADTKGGSWDLTCAVYLLLEIP